MVSEQFGYHIWIQHRQVYKDHAYFYREIADADQCKAARRRDP
jgi:hypothetical protein